MLSELHISNFALIEQLDLRLGAGLNILTGETGAGKSIFIDAINALLGERAGVDVVRSGADKAVAEGVFTLGDAPGATSRLKEEGLYDDADSLILSREVSRFNQGAARINGRRATVSLLKSIGADLVDLHGQHDHQTLLEVDRHIDILDAWGGDNLFSVREQAAVLYRRLKNLESELSNLQADERERSRMADLYAFQVAEIDAAEPRAEEEEELLAERTRLAGAEKLAAAGDEAHKALTSESGGALEGLASAVNRLRDAVRLDDAVQPMLDAVESAYYNMQEIANDVSGYISGIEFNPTRLELVEERLDILRRLKRKYGDTLEAVLSFRDHTAAELAGLQGSEERAAQLESEIATAREELYACCSRLSSLRNEAGESLRKAMERELTELAMGKTKVAVSIEPCPASVRGADRVEFLISPNPGEPLKPLSRIASGGELSRLMLALKSVVANAVPVPVLIFDEIDTGVSGRQAAVIARKMRALAAKCQVLCVTHLPQIAAAAAHHYVISKVEENGRTVTKVTTLDEGSRVEEIARLLAGATATEAARANARELISEFRRP